MEPFKRKCNTKRSEKYFSWFFYTIFWSYQQPRRQIFSTRRWCTITNILYKMICTLCLNELDLHFTIDDILRGISDLKWGKSGGPDNLLNKFFVYGEDVLSNYFLNFFNKILSLGYFPESWEECLIVPIHKEGSVSEVSIFLGITLLF